MLGPGLIFTIALMGLWICSRVYRRPGKLAGTLIVRLAKYVKRGRDLKFALVVTANVKKAQMKFG
jgi:hypothetical protein